MPTDPPGKTDNPRRARSQAAPPIVQLPHNFEAEITVLGAAILDPEIIPTAAAILSPGDFYSEKHRRTFSAILALAGRGDPVDLRTVTYELRHRGELELVGGSAALTALIEDVPTAANVTYHARVVKDYARRRSVVEACNRAAERALVNGHGPAEDLEAIVGDLEGVLLTTAEVPQAQDETRGVDAFLSTPPELDWDVKSVRLRGDHGWIGGAPKGMKGLTSLEEARACATGTLFLGHFPTRKATVLYVSEEDRTARLHRRVHAMLAGRPPEEIPGSEDLRFLVKAGVRLDTPEGLGILRAALERWRPEIVFLEHFDKLHSRDGSKAVDVKPLLDELDKLHVTFGCVFRVQKHFRKEAGGQSKRPGEMLAGSVALFGWGESSIYLTLIRKGVAQVEVEAKDGDTAPRFLVEYQDGRIVYGGEVKTDKKEAARARVLELLEATPGATTAAMAEGLKVSIRTAKTRLSELEQAGLVAGKQEHSKAPKQWSRIYPSEKEEKPCN